MRFNPKLIPVFTALILTFGCGTVENKIIEKSNIITHASKKAPAEKSLPSLPVHAIKKQPSSSKRIAPQQTLKHQSPDSLIGLNSHEIGLLLGSPHFKRRDTAAQIWQYRSGGCVLSLFLYPSSKGLSVSHLDTRSHIDKSISSKKCFTNIFFATQKKPG